MLNELKPNEFYKIEPIVKDIRHNHVVIFSVISGQTPGKIIVDDTKKPKSAIIIPEGGFYYICSPEEDTYFLQACHHLFFNEWKVNILELFLFPQSIDISLLLGNRKYISFKRHDYRLNKDKFKQLQITHTTQLITDNKIKDIPKQAIKDGLAYCITENNQLLSYSVACFQYQHEMEISCKTEENAQKQGLATSCCHQLIKSALNKNLTPSWSCWEFNEASNHLAKKLGFELIDTKNVYIWDTYIDQQK